MSAHRLTQLLATAAAVLPIACGPGPKPATLLTFERLRKEAAATAIKSQAPKLWKDSENYYQLAYEAWEDSDDEEAREYTLLGTILYHTGREVARKAKIEAELQVFEATVKKARRRRDHWAKEKQRTEQAVSALQGQLAMANQLVALERKRTEEMAAFEAKMKEDQALQEIRQRHADLLLRLKDTERVAAAKYASGEYNKAKNLLDKAAMELEVGQHREAGKTLEQAASQIAAAMEAAQPRFTAVENTKKREDMNQRLVAVAHTVGVSSVRVEPRGVVLVLHGLFKRKKTRIVRSKELMLDKVGQLLNEFSEYRILIEGHTDDRGKDDANLTRSQAWANAVMGHFVSKGIATRRMQSTGYGESAPLVENTRAGRKRNRRVELVFLFPRD